MKEEGQLFDNRYISEERGTLKSAKPAGKEIKQASKATSKESKPKQPDQGTPFEYIELDKPKRITYSLVRKKEDE